MKKDHPGGWLEASVEPLPGAQKSGRALKKEWVRMVVEAVKLRRESPEASAHAIAQKLDQLLVDNGLDQPAPSKLWELVDWVFSFDDNPLIRRKGKRGNRG